MDEDKFARFLGRMLTLAKAHDPEHGAVVRELAI